MLVVVDVLSFVNDRLDCVNDMRAVVNHGLLSLVLREGRKSELYRARELG